MELFSVLIPCSVYTGKTQLSTSIVNTSRPGMNWTHSNLTWLLVVNELAVVVVKVKNCIPQDKIWQNCSVTMTSCQLVSSCVRGCVGVAVVR